MVCDIWFTTKNGGNIWLFLRLKKVWGAPFPSLTLFPALEIIRVDILWALYGCIILGVQNKNIFVEIENEVCKTSAKTKT
jgi:hypothetical protein